MPSISLRGTSYLVTQYKEGWQGRPTAQDRQSVRLCLRPPLHPPPPSPPPPPPPRLYQLQAGGQAAHVVEHDAHLPTTSPGVNKPVNIRVQLAWHLPCNSMPVCPPPAPLVIVCACARYRAEVEEARDVAAKQREQLHRQRPAALQHPRTHKRGAGGGWEGGMMSTSISWRASTCIS